MLKGWMRDITLAIQVRSGASTALFVWIGIIIVAAVTAFIFLCVAGYDWFAVQYGSVFGGLIMAGIFLAIAVIGSLICAYARRRTMQRALLARAARAQATSWWLDPRVLAAGLQAGRSLGWQRLVPFALLGFMAATWAREHRNQSHGDQT
jgi:uncharacterized membrane protein